MIKFVCTLYFFLSVFNGIAQEKNTGTHHNIFNPTPNDSLRELATDRPDVTESAYTVDAGHFQFETDLFKSEQSKIDGVKEIDNYYNVANCKIGLTNTLDLQLVVSTFSTEKNISGGNILKRSGFGGLTIRAKKNLWGDDRGKTAFAILPFVDIPTDQSQKITGGIVFPLALSLSNSWEIGVQFETDLAALPNADSYHFNYLASATASHSLFKSLDFFSEMVLTRNNDIGIYEYFLNGGLIYSVSKNINVDSGVYYGMKKNSSKTFFLGLSFRI